MLLTIGATIVVLGVLIFVHELGHFMAAKAVGIGVPRFSIGLGPATPLSFRRGETEYVISWIPFGGYVKMATAEESDMEVLEGGSDAEKFPPHKMFETKPLWARILVISAGVIMNAIFAYAVHAFLLATYGTAEDPTTSLAAVDSTRLPPTAQALAGVPFGAQVIRINGDTIENRGAIRDKVLGPSSGPLRFEFANGIAPVTVGSSGYVAEEREGIFTALTPLWPARILAVVSGTPAAEAGFESGDVVVGIDGDSVRSWWDMQGRVSSSADVPLEVSVMRGDSLVVIPVTPRTETLTDPITGETIDIGQLGVTVDSPIRRVRTNLVGAMIGGVGAVRDDAQLILFALRELVLGRMSARELGGPVLIGQISGQTARLGPVAFLGFMALFSINLAILNLLPIPVLDGGQLVFLFAEGVRGKPLSMGLRMRLTQFGLVILVGIMLLALTNDLRRVFGL